MQRNRLNPSSSTHRLLEARLEEEGGAKPSGCDYYRARNNSANWSLDIAILRELEDDTAQVRPLRSQYKIRVRSQETVFSLETHLSEAT